MVYDLGIILVEASTQVSLNSCQTNSIGNSLSQGPCSIIDLVTQRGDSAQEDLQYESICLCDRKIYDNL